MKRAELAGKAEPFRTEGRQSREEHSREQLIWTALELAPGSANGEVQPLMAESVPRKALRNTLHNGVRQAIVMLSAVCTSILVARTLGPANMGVYGFTVWLVGMLGVFANLGLPGAATKYIAEFLGRGDPANGVTRQPPSSACSSRSGGRRGVWDSHSWNDSGTEL